MAKKLTPKQKKFCELYATETEFFGNGVQSYIQAYNIDVKKKGAYNSARQTAYKLLTKVDILLYIDELLDSEGLNEQFVDKQILFLIRQNADFGSKLGAIKEFNSLKGRITKKINQTGDREGLTIKIGGKDVTFK